MRVRPLLRIAFVSLFVVIMTLSSRVEANDFYRGKQVRIVSHSVPGGIFDLMSRTLAMHMGRHIPGNPSMLVQNMPGGGGLIQANYLFEVAKRDGLTLGVMPGGTIQWGALGLPGVKFKSDEFEWIGLLRQSPAVIVARRDAPIRTLEDLLDPKAKAPLILGSASPPSSLYTFPAAVNLVFENQIGKAPFKLVTGYKGTPDLRAALERGEIDGYTTSWDTLQATAADYLKPAPGKGFVNLLGYLGVERDQNLDDFGVPFVPDRVKQKKDRAVLDLVLAPTLVGAALAAPPGVPKENLKVLQAAFMNTLSDSRYMGDFQKLGMTTKPWSGEQLNKYIRSLMATPKEVIEAAKPIVVK